MIDTKKYYIRITYVNSKDKLFDRFYLTNVTDYENTNSHHNFEYVRSMSAEKLSAKLSKKDVYRYVKYLFDHPNKLPSSRATPEYMSIDIRQEDNYNNGINMYTISEDILKKIRIL